MVTKEQAGNLLSFLADNAEWNDNYQAKEFARYLHPNAPSSARLVALLEEISLTQQRPKVGSLSKFWRHARELEGMDSISLEQLIAHLESAPNLKRPKPGSQGIWSRLFIALERQPGWGPKTSALFVRSCIDIHRDKSPSGQALHFLKDGEATARRIDSDDKIHLPVDEVIIQIFGIGGTAANTAFDKINAALNVHSFTNEDFLLWDDLWFWGHLTQTVVPNSKDRRHGWNTDKFWILRSMPWRRHDELRKRATQFVDVLNRIGLAKEPVVKGPASKK